jgi:hypothetical protein
MNKITIKGDTAIVQGGASNLDMTRELWNAKKYTGMLHHNTGDHEY